MKSLIVKIGLIAALFVILCAMLGAFLGGVIGAKADRYVTLSGTSIFNTAGNAQIWAHRIEQYDGDQKIEDPEDPVYYAMFTFGANEDKINYRKNLAYSWIANALDVYDSASSDETEEGGEETEPVKKAEAQAGYFSIELGFEEINFEKFVLCFETQQYTMTEDSKTSNFVIFLPEKNSDGENTGKVVAFITSDKELAEKDADKITVPEGRVALDPDYIVIALDKSETNGEYAAYIYNNAGETEENLIPADQTLVQREKFENVGKMYAKYVSSSSNPVTPLSFSAQLPEGAGGTPQSRVRVAIYNMNGQSFVLNRDSEGETYASASRKINKVDDGDGKYHFTGGQVNDLMPPVLCLDKNITHITRGGEIGFNFTAVDVLTSSPDTKVGYFMLTTEQAGEQFDAEDYEAENLFSVVKDSDDQYIYPHAKHYLPVEGDYSADSKLGDELVPVAAVKVYVQLTDTTSTGAQSTYVFLDWYVSDEYKLTVNGNSYIAVAEDKQGATYNYDNTTATYETKDEAGNPVTYTGWQALVAEYQDKVTAAAKNLRAGKDDFYLPSFEKLVSDNATAYSDTTFSIYYLANGNQSTNTNKSASQLSIDLTAAGDYHFTVYANDAASNDMWYIDKDGEKKEFDVNSIWDMYDDEDDFVRSKLPWFSFTAGTAAISVEDPGEQNIAYVGSTYTADSFEIEGISTSAAYSLYLFDGESYFKDKGETLTYESFMENKQQLFEENRNYFRNIPAASGLEEGSEEYEQFAAYDWNATSRSFVPQDENAFYLIRCRVTSTQFIRMDPVDSYMGIASSAAPRAIAGENTWLADNLTSIILLSIAGAALVGIVLLLVIKPKDKGDIDVQFEKEVAAKSAKTKNK